MKKIISIFLAVLMIFSVSTVAFAGSYKEEAAQKGVLMRCPYCDNCKGTFAKLTEDDEYGCSCCEKCPNYVVNGVAVNVGNFTGCAYDFYHDKDVYKYDSEGQLVTDADNNPILEHKGDYTFHYYWKARCCDECTGRKGCRCNNTDYKDAACGCPSCLYEPDHTEEKIHEGIEKGQEGYTKGIQAALIAMRDVMYDLFNKLFAFLRIDIILGKDRVPSETV